MQQIALAIRNILLKTTVNNNAYAIEEFFLLLLTLFEIREVNDVVFFLDKVISFDI